MSTEPVQAAAPLRRWAVAGNPNSGKSTLFNALTGLQQRVANFAGVTVEKREGRLRGSAEPIALIDLPGVYSLSPRTPDECIPRDVLFGLMQGTPPPQAVLIVIDASNLERNLYLASQLLELGLPAALACNMIDRAEAAGATVDLAALARELGVPVFATVGHVKRGVAELRAALAKGDFRPAGPRRWHLPAAVERVIAELSASLAQAGVVPRQTADAAALVWLAEGPFGAIGDEAGGKTSDEAGADLPAAVRPLVRAARMRLAEAGADNPAGLIVEARYAWINGVAERVVRRAADFGRRVRRGDRIDRVLTHGAWGPAIFLGVMLGIFWSIFALAEPLMGAIEFGQQWLAGTVRGALAAGPLRDLLADGVIGGAGAVVVFFPQICILFLFIAVLEDSGYMARAAFVSHRLMSRAGLPGKSFIPLVSSFACAIPGVMATRVIEHRRDRLLTILIAPLMSCSARLPVYLTVIGAVFGGRLWLQTGVIASMYLLSAAAALGAAAVLKRTLLRGAAAPFIIELPPYQIPRPGAVLRTMWERARLFLTGAGTTIVALCVVLWALAYFPRDAAGERRAAERGAAVLAMAERGESRRDGGGDSVPHPDSPSSNTGWGTRAERRAAVLAMAERGESRRDGGGDSVPHPDSPSSNTGWGTRAERRAAVLAMAERGESRRDGGGDSVPHPDSPSSNPGWGTLANTRSAAVTTPAANGNTNGNTGQSADAALADALREIEREQSAAQLRQSYLGRAGRFIEPVVRPLGFDWKIGIGVLASFAAREVFVGTMGTLYSVGDAQGEGGQLRERMRADVWEDGPRAGRPVFSVAAGLSLMVFYVLCCQCVGTLAVVKRETNSWRWPMFMLAYMTALAYVGSLAVYQVGSRLGG